MRSRRKRRRNKRCRPLSIQPLERRMLLHAEGVLGGTVYFDSDGDGQRDAIEAGVPGVVLQLTSSDASVSRSAITDNNGDYVFDELEPGDYQITKRQMRATSNGFCMSSSVSTLMPSSE